MKFAKYILCGAIASMALVSCVKEAANSDLDPNTEQPVKAKGSISLNVSAVPPKSTADSSAATRAVDTQNFEVEIKNEKGEIVKHYDNRASVPNSIDIAVGKYTIVAHTPGECQKEMVSPYYNGSVEAVVTEGVNTQVGVTCKQQNNLFKVDAEALTQFKSWVITFDDGSHNVFKFESESDVREKYFWLADNTKELTVNFVGYFDDEKTLASRVQKVFTKADSSTQYDDEDGTFHGGESYTFTLLPEEGEGVMQSVVINVHLDFTYDEHDVIIDVTDKADEPVDPVPPVGGDDVVKLTIPEPITFTQAEGFGGELDPTIGDVVVEASAGIKSLKIRIGSDNKDFIAALQDVASQYEGMDLVNGCEVVDNQNLVEFLGSLGQELAVPAEGDTECTFPMGNFFLFLATFTAEYQFHFELTDMKGNKTSAIVKITVTK